MNHTVHLIYSIVRKRLYVQLLVPVTPWLGFAGERISAAIRRAGVGVRPCRCIGVIMQSSPDVQQKQSWRDSLDPAV
jgi:hypothetical protein